MVPRKARREITCIETVLKLPQVGEASSLRRSGELWLRNSANSPRNFGRRGASLMAGRSEEAQPTVY